MCVNLVPCLWLSGVHLDAHIRHVHVGYIRLNHTQAFTVYKKYVPTYTCRKYFKSLVARVFGKFKKTLCETQFIQFVVVGRMLRFGFSCSCNCNTHTSKETTHLNCTKCYHFNVYYNMPAYDFSQYPATLLQKPIRPIIHGKWPAT